VAQDRADRADRVAQGPADQEAPVAQDRVAPVDRAIRVAREDMNRVVDTAATGRADMTPAAPADMTQAAPADMTPAGRADLATPGGTIPADPEVMTRERPGVQSRVVPGPADLASPGVTIPVGRVLLGRMPGRRPLTAEPPLLRRALLHPTPADRRWDHQTQADLATRREALTWAAAVRPADRTLRLEALRPVGATPRRK
jgi:hypothetical protein